MTLYAIISITNDSETTAALDTLHRALQAIGAETTEQPTPLPQAA